MYSYFAAMGIVLLLMLGWISVQHLARLFAARHPEYGPAREEGAGCGSGCTCSSAGGCQRDRDR